MENNEAPAEKKELTFEDALTRLETIVDKMERGNIPLEQMIKYFEQGNKLSSFCGSKLKELEKKIEILVKETPEGGEWADFEPGEGRGGSSSAPPSRPAARSVRRPEPPQERNEPRDSGEEDALF